MKKFFINIRYFIVPVLCSVTILGLIVGGPFVWTGAVLFLVGITIDTLVIKFHTKGAGFDENGKSYGIKELQNLVMYFMLPVFIILQVALAWRVYQYTNGADFGLVTLFGWLPIQTGITGLELYGATLSAGAFAGLGIIYGHELSHTKDIGWPISRLMMGLSGAAHFCYAHVYILSPRPALPVGFRLAVPVLRGVAGRQRRVPEDQVSRLLGRHHHRGVDVAVGQRRHDRGVHHP